MWADTYEIGCGAVYREDTLRGIHFPAAKIYVCNYGPTGNIISGSMYKVGYPASKCENGYSPRYFGLCA